MNNLTIVTGTYCFPIEQMMIANLLEILVHNSFIYSNQGGPIESKLKESEVRQVTIHAWLSQHKLCGTSCSEDQMQYCPGK